MTNLVNMKRIFLSILFMLSALVSFSQQVFTAKGVVVDETGETIIGATVKIIGDSKLIQKETSHLPKLKKDLS